MRQLVARPIAYLLPLAMLALAVRAHAQRVEFWSFPTPGTKLARCIESGAAYQGREGARTAGGRFLYNRGVDLAWVGHVLHPVRHRVQSRRVVVGASSPYPDEAFVIQTMRELTNAIVRTNRSAYALQFGDRNGV